MKVIPITTTILRTILICKSEYIILENEVDVLALFGIFEVQMTKNTPVVSSSLYILVNHTAPPCGL